MLIATIRSRILEKHSPNAPAEGGFYELKLELLREDLANAASPRDRIKREVARGLASLHIHTGIPVGEGIWHVTFPEQLKKKTNLKDFFA